MNEKSSNPAGQGAGTDRNPWKTGVIATGVAFGVLVAAGLTFAALNEAGVFEEDSGPAAQVAATSSSTPQQRAPAQPAAAPEPEPRENCSVHLADAQRDNTRVVKDGAVGAMVGAGTGAAGGAIADGGDGAGKGAGIGAVVGAVAGAFHGLTEEDKRASAAEQAYRDCLARNG